MNDKIQSDKSPRSPNYTLEDALAQVKKLHSQIGKAEVKPESAAVAMGYKGLNGAALTTLGTLSQYGLIERSKRTVTITPLAIRILHPMGDSQFNDALREAALAPKVFQEIHENFGQCSVEVLSSHLVQNGFTPDRAKRTASVYAANKGFANLGDAGTNKHVETAKRRTDDTNSEGITRYKRELPPEKSKEEGVLAQYSIPLGGNEATLTFKGDSLSISDFDALIEYVELFKKQFERKKVAAEKQQQDLIGSFFGGAKAPAAPTTEQEH
jgi:hypothetical protein